MPCGTGSWPWPPSSQFRLVRTHVAARAVLELAAARDTVLADIGRAAETLTVQAITGNPVDVLEVGADEAAVRLASGRPVWRDIRRDGRVVHGLSLDELAGALSA